MKASRNIQMKLCSMTILIVSAAVLLAVCILPASALTCDSDMCVNETGWWNASGEFNASSTSIQHAIDNATAGYTIYVYNGSYTENVNVDKRLTLQGEGADVVTVKNSTAYYHVFVVSVDYVNISGFNVTGATGTDKAGIYLLGRQHCNISNNTGSGNFNGIYLSSSSNNTLTNNRVNLNDDQGIRLISSSNNTLTNNTADSNDKNGIFLTASSSYNMLTNNTANSNSKNGIYLYSSSNNNTLTNNTADSNIQYGIFLYSSSNNIITNNIASNNEYGILVYSSSDYNTLTNNTASNNEYGIFLNVLSDYNTIYNNYFNNTYNAGDTGNNIWNTTPTTGTNIIGGSWLGGNYWSDYTGSDTNGDGLGDNQIPYNSGISTGGDYHPLATPGSTPPVPTSLQSTTGNYWVNYTWTAGTGIVTDGYNVTMNNDWYNTTETFLNSTVGAGNWSNITVWAWNATGNGNMSAAHVSDNVQAPAAPTDTIPPVPTNLQNSTGNDWVNYTWTVGTGIVTDGYNVSMNDAWYNKTDTFLNSTVGAGNWSNITVWAWNATGNGNMSATNVSDNVQVPAEPTDTTDPVVNTVTLNTTAPNTGDAILVTVNATDNVAVTNVTANGVELTFQIGNIWNGTITALAGTHIVNVSATDAVDNVGWNNSTSYTTTTTDLYNITFLPPITTMDQFNLKDGRTLPIKFTSQDNDTGDFIYDDTVNVTITNSTGHLITYFTYATGSESVRINTREEQYIVNFHTRNYALNVGETYVITVIFGEPGSLEGYEITDFTLVYNGKGK